MARYYFNCTGGQTYWDWNERYTSGAGLGSDYACGNNEGDGVGNFRSIILFNSTDIRTKLSGQRVTGCYLDIYVKDSYYNTFNLYIGTHNYTNVPDIWSSSRVNRNRLNRNEQPRGQITGWSLGTGIGTEFKDGVTTGIACGPAFNDDYNYFYTLAPNGDSREPLLIIDAESINVAPNAPTLNSPAADTVMDTTSGVTFSWTHNDPNGDPQSAYRFRRRLPNGSFEYWSGTAWTSTQTDIVNTGQVLTVPAGLWASDLRIEWAVATRDASGLWGSYSAPRALFSSVRPTVSVTSVDTNTPRPTIRWAFADADGDPQYGWSAQIVEPAVYNDPGWNPDNYLRQYWSTSGEGTTNATQVGRELRNQQTYRAYVKVSSSPNPSGGLQWSNWASREFQVIIPPSASAITAPQNGSVTDLAAGFTLTWANSYYQSVGSQTAVSIRRQISGQSTFQYWSGSAWVTIAAGAQPPYLASTAQAYSFRAGDVTNGATYTFSVSIRDNYNQVSPWSAGVTVEGSTAATVTVLDPPPVSVVSNPMVTWTMFDPENDLQQTYQVRVIHSSVYEAAGAALNPGTASAVWATTEVIDTGGTTRTLQIGTDLQNANRYRVYVRVKTNGVYSGWSYAQFDISLVPPAAPTVSAVTGDGYADITFQGRDSILDGDSSRNFGNWIAANNCTVANSIQFGSSASGYASRITSSGSGLMHCVTYNAWPIEPGQVYTGAVNALAALNMTAVQFYVAIEWLDINLALHSVSNAPPILDDAAVRSSVTAPAPVGASYGRLRVAFQSVPSAGQQHTFFNPVFRPGTGDEWSPGGTLSQTFVTLTESTEDRIIRFGRNVPLPVATQRVTVRDYEIKMGAPQIYTGTTRAVYPNAALVSPVATSNEVFWVDGLLWISDPTRPGSARTFEPVSFDAIVRPVRQGKFRPIGRPDAVITSGVRGLREGSYTIIAHDRDTREAYTDLITSSEVILIRIPPDTADPRIADLEGETIYARVEGDAPEERPLPSRTPHRTIKQAWVEQRSPDSAYDYVDVD